MPTPSDPQLPPVPASFPSFFAAFGTEERCLAHVFRTRYPAGFRCDDCGSRSYRLIRRATTRCTSCHTKSSLLTGTILENTKLPLKLWFRAIHLFRRAQMTARKLSRVIGVNYKTAWLWAHKIRAAMQSHVTHISAKQIDPRSVEDPEARRLEEAFVIWGGGLRLRWSRAVDHSHGCERLRHPDLATPDQRHLPWKRWEEEKGPRPTQRLWFCDDVRDRLRGRRQTALLEKHLQKYLDEYAFRSNHHWFKHRQLFAHLLDLALSTRAPTYRRLIASPDRDEPRPWLVITVAEPTL